ncbi:YggS family pyridoxal phosphate-dependent enzyme [Dysgonomonas sp. 511]|uniref:YggS family pyridoxal phosphate-dependent enzyme n=1 Tax=Dysgonomonas sp. 511 TaxID=2302930 RepID=UPI0013D72391|nr:YggS family pyridoxal phosphate-dependent enzyme [Dysgonomonas sp. 511]
MNVADNIQQITDTIPEGVKLVAVSKFHPAGVVQQAYDAGQRIFGESRMQEIDKKHTELPGDIEWHFIGHLQTNKVKFILPYTHTIHSIDSWKLLAEIEKQASAINKPVCCLLEIHIAAEDAKYGLTFDECRKFLAEGLWKDCKFAYIGGLMGMATYTEDEDQIRKEFRSLKQFFDEVKSGFFSEYDNFSELSMGMSGDYKIAIEEGSTMIRVGSSIFGEREY